MSKRKSVPPKLYRWRISRTKATPAVEVGTVEAPDPDAAIKVAIERYGITNVWHQQRLVAQRIN
jgi:hypothetical protein